MTTLLTTKEAAAQLRMDRKEFLQLPIPYVLFAKRKRRYRQEDIDSFVNSKLMYDSPLPIIERHKKPASVSVAPTPFRLPRWKEAMAQLKAEQQRDGERKK
jgi:hypothetical protein